MRERPNTQSTNLHHTMQSLHHTMLNLHHTTHHHYIINQYFINPFPFHTIYI